MRINLSSGGPPRPPAPARHPGDVPSNPAVLSALLGGEREELLAGLATGLELDQPDQARQRRSGVDDAATRPWREAMLRVLSATNLVTLRQTLETAATRGSLGAITTAVGLEELLALGRSKGLNVNDVLATTGTVAVRGLTTSESQRVMENFAGTLDPATVRLEFATGTQTIGAGAATLGNTVNVDPTDPRWGIKTGTTLPRNPRDEGWDGFNSVILAHELTHVWSYQHVGSAYATTSIQQQVEAIATTGNRNAAYFYTPGKPRFFDYGEEQRAMMVQDYLAAGRAQREGRAQSPTMYGGAKPPAEILATLEPYLRELRAFGPGQPQPPGTPRPIDCLGGRKGFTQDGVAGTLGRDADALLAAAGRASTAAIQDGLKKGNAAEVAVGVLGTGAAIGASLISREQNLSGATSGGSAVLDQAGIPRGVSIERDGVKADAKLGWDAPAPARGQSFSVGMKNPRVEASVDVSGTAGRTDASGHADASIGLDGTLKEAGVAGQVSAPGGSAAAKARLWPESGDRPLRAVAELQVTTPEASVSASGEVTARGGVLQSAEVQAQLEARRLSASGQASFAREGDSLAFKQGALGVGVQLTPEVSLAARAAVLAKGLEAVEVTVAANPGPANVAVTGYGRALTTTPTFGGSVTAGTPEGAVSVSAEATPSTGGKQVTVGVKVPLP